MHQIRIIGNNIIKLDAVDSTNTYASTLLKNQNVHEGLVVVAVEQLAGRGQMGTNWHASSGQSLTFSVILKPQFLKPDMQFYLSMAISIGLVKYLRAKGIVDSFIKWPNDLYVGKKKIAGILIENNLSGNWINSSIVGIGFNINSSPEEFAASSTSLKAITGEDYDLEVELASICDYLNSQYWDLQRLKFERLKDIYMDHLWGWGYKTNVPVKKDGEVFNVWVEDVQPSGKLVLEKENENDHPMIVSFKEIEWIFS